MITRKVDPCISVHLREGLGKSCPLAGSICIDGYILAFAYYSS